MSKTLVISDNEILNIMYTMNLEVYLATHATICSSAEKAFDLLEKDKNYQLILTTNQLKGQDISIVVYDYLKKLDCKIPLVVIGNPAKLLPDVEVVQSSYNLQNLLRVSAKILGVTAKSMASLEVPEFFAIETQYLCRVKTSPCQVYARDLKTQTYELISKRGESLSDKAKSLKEKGIEKLYVYRFDRLIIINSLSSLLTELIMSTPNLDVKEKSKALESGFEFVANDFCQSPEAFQEVMELANACTAAMEDVATSTPNLKSLLNILTSNKSGHLYTHTILATYVSSHILKNVSWGGQSQIEKVNFVLFFHDIVLAPIYQKYPDLKFEEDLVFSELLNESEKETVLNHARLAAELMISYKNTPIGVDLLIKQHHGMTNGVGFAVEFKDDISPLSKVVLIAESFVSEFLHSKEIDPEAKLDIKKVINELNNIYKKSSYKKIIETLNTIRL